MDNLILGRRPPLLREVAGMIFGIVFVLTGGYSGLEYVLGLIGAPLLYAEQPFVSPDYTDRIFIWLPLL